MDCAVCRQPGKYKCPECKRPTCSLGCSQAHKEQFQCSGSKVRTRFVPTKDFSLSHLNSDVCLITDIARQTNSAHKQITKLAKFDTRKRFAYLLTRCREQNIAVRMLPKCMSRHLHNASYFDKALETIFWQSEWHFVGRKQKIVTVTIERTSERSTLSECLSAALEHLSSNAEFLYELSQLSISLDSITCAVLWLREKARADEDRVMHVFAQVSPALTLAEALRKYYTQSHPIIEYPEFYIAPKEVLPELIIITQS